MDILKIKGWWKYINWFLFIILLVEIIIPSFYTIIRIGFLSRINDNDSVYIGSLNQYTSMLYFLFKDSFILGVYFYLGKNLRNNDQNKASVIKTVSTIVISISFIVVLLITIFLKPILYNSEIVNNTSNINITIDFLYINIWVTFLKIIVFLISILLIFSKKEKYILYLISIRLMSLIIFDTILFYPSTSIWNKEIIGYPLSDLISEIIVIIVGVFFVLKSYQLNIYKLVKAKFIRNNNDFFRVSSFSFFESLIRNFFVIITISYLSQLLGQDGYIIWYISITLYWSLLLVPLYSLQEDVKYKTSGIEKNNQEKQVIFSNHILVTIIFFVWLILIPVIYFIIDLILNNNEDIEKLVFLSFIVMLIPQFLYSFTRIWDQILYSKGETKLLLFRTIIISIIFFIPLSIILRINSTLIVGTNTINYLSPSILYSVMLFLEFLSIWPYYYFLKHKYFDK